MTITLIWGSAAIIYAIFWLWYVGLSRKVKPHEIDEALQAIQSKGKELNQQFIQDLRQYLEDDDGKDFVMVNLLELKKPILESQKKLQTYQNIFLGNLLKRAGHPIFVARMPGFKIENLDCDHENWRAAGMVRYRSRRDLMEMMLETVGSEHHSLKLDSLQRTVAYPSSYWTIAGGPKLVVPLAIALIAALLQIVFT